MRLIAAPLDFFGRQATRMLAVGVLAGIAIPQLATLMRPLLIVGLVVPLTIALVRIDWAALWAYGRRPGLIGLLAVFLLVLSPLLMAAVTWPLGLPVSLRTALVLMAAAPPIVSAGALALILGLDAALIVVTVVVCTALVPFSLPPMALWLLDLQINIGLLALMGRLGAIVGFAFLAAFLVRRMVSARWLAEHARELDGLSVLNLLIFSIAIMAGVTATLLARPGFVALVIAVSFAANLILQALGAGAFAFLGRREALSVGLMTGNCNMGLVLVTLADRADLDVVLYFAIAQIPMYMLPALLLPLYRRLMRN